MLYTHTPTSTLTIRRSSSGAKIPARFQSRMRISGVEQPPRVLRALEALKKAASQLQQEAVESVDGARDHSGSPSKRALLELERQSEGLLGHDPDLDHLAELLAQLRDREAETSSTTCSSSPKPTKQSASFLSASLKSLFRLRSGAEAEGEAVASLAAGIEEEIQAWIDRENVYRVASGLQSLVLARPSAEEARGDGAEEREHPDESVVACLLSAMESRLSLGFDARYQAALLRSGAFPFLLAALTSPSASSSKLVKESCASAVAAAVRFNPAVFVGPVLASSSSVVRSLAGMATPNSARALCALVSAIRTPLVDEMEARGEIPLVVGLLRKPAELAAAALGAVMEMGRHGRREAVQAMVEAEVVEKLVKLELDFGSDEEDGEGDHTWKESTAGVRAGEVGIEEKSLCVFQGCVARFAVQVDTGRGMGRRDKREVRAELVRRLRTAAEADARAGNILAEVLWDIT